MVKPVLIDLDFGGTAKVTGLPAPTLASDAVNKTYADASAGVSGDVQFNNAGVDAGAANVKVEGGQLRLVDNAAPVAPAAGGSKMTSTRGAGMSFPAFVNPAGRAQRLQRSLENSSAMLWRGNATLATITTLGGGTATAVGTATLASPADTNKFTRMPRTEFLVTVAAVGAIAGIRVGPLIAKVGGAAADLGGFYFCGIWGPATGVATLTTQALFGLSNTFGAATSVEPSTLSNQIVMAWDSADTNIQIMHNLIAAAATKIDLGVNFPVPTADRTSVYQLELFSPPGLTQSCSYLVTDLTTGATATGVITANLPANTTLLTWRGWIGSGATSSVIGFSFVSAMLEPF